jgi:hypothetical protein
MYCYFHSGSVKSVKNISQKPFSFFWSISGVRLMAGHKNQKSKILMHAKKSKNKNQKFFAENDQKSKFFFHLNFLNFFQQVIN